MHPKRAMLQRPFLLLQWPFIIIQFVPSLLPQGLFTQNAFLHCIVLFLCKHNKHTRWTSLTFALVSLSMTIAFLECLVMLKEVQLLKYAFQDPVFLFVCFIFLPCVSHFYMQKYIPCEQPLKIEQWISLTSVMLFQISE